MINTWNKTRHGNSHVNPLRAKFLRGKINIYHQFYVITPHWYDMYLNSVLKLDQDLHILHSQYHGCWCPGDVSSQGINSHDIDLVNTLRPRQDGRRFPNDTFKRIFLKENVIILIKISLKFVPNGPIDNTCITALVQIMAWRWPGDKPLSEPMMVILPTHICVTRPQWVKPR